jgi:hypothetical protein
MSEEIYCTVWTKDGKQELTEKQWVNFNDSKLHRENNLPAVEKLYRENNLSAVEHSSGSKYWYLNGKLHRTDGPAIEYPDGSKEWWLNGKLHRTDGPAVQNLLNNEEITEWALDGIFYSKEDHSKEINKIKEMNSLERMLDPRDWVRNFKE